MISDEAVEAAMDIALDDGLVLKRSLIHELLEAAAPFIAAQAGEEAYRLGVEDERTSQANPGIAGCFCSSSRCGCVIEPARVNPYRSVK